MIKKEKSLNKPYPKEIISMKIKDIMTRNVITVGKGMKVLDAAKAMASKPVSCLIVMEKNKPLGLLTERDLVREIIVSRRKAEKTKVEEIMTHPMRTIAPDTDVVDAVNIMKTKHARRFIVLQKNRLVGLVTETDIVNATIRLGDELVEKLAKGNLSVKDYKREYAELAENLKDVKSLYNKINTGSEDLNEIIGGGYPIGSNIMIEGLPGSGKIVLGFAFLHEGIRENDTCIYIYGNETLEDINNSFKSMGFVVENVDKKEHFYFISVGEKQAKSEKNIYVIHIDDLNKISSTIEEITNKSKGKVRCVINILSEMMMRWKAQTIYQFMLKLTQMLKENKVTTLFLLEEGMHESKEVISMEQIMDGVIKLNSEEKGMEIEKKLFIKKMGSGASAPQKYFNIEFDPKKKIISIQD